MPPSDPGQLDEQTYADLEAYILQANGLAPGTTELTAAELGGIRRAGSTANPTEFSGRRTPESQAIVTQYTLAAMARRAAELNKITPVTDEMLQHPPDGDWLTWRRTYSSLGLQPS